MEAQENLMVSEETRLKVKRGAYLLEQYGITDLREQINLDRLNVMSHQMCVLGQTFGEYNLGTETLELTEEEAVENGFLAIADTVAVIESGRVRYDMRREEYAELTQAWKEYLS